MMSFIKGASSVLVAQVVLGGITLASEGEWEHEQYCKVFYERVIEENSNNNVVVSPLSASIVVSMLIPGSDGETSKEIAQALKVSGDDGCKQISAFNKSLNNSNDLMSLESSNSIWVKDSYTLKEAYVTKIKDLYESDIFSVKAKDNLKNLINKYVSEKTHGMIKELIKSDLSDMIASVLVNTLYFKGRWIDEFEPIFGEHYFNSVSDGKVKADFMLNTGSFEYARTTKYESVILPYVGREAEMVVVLPRDDFGIKDCVESYFSENFENEFEDTHIDLQMPKYEVEFSRSLSKDFKAMGMKKAFGEEADFSKMTDSDFCVDEILQSAKIKVAEEGTEAAAATAVLMKCMALPMRPKYNMVVNRPFFYVLRTKDKHILFMGHVVNPAK